MALCACQVPTTLLSLPDLADLENEDPRALEMAADTDTGGGEVRKAMYLPPTGLASPF